MEESRKSLSVGPGDLCGDYAGERIRGKKLLEIVQTVENVCSDIVPACVIDLESAGIDINRREPLLAHAIMP
ncbi:hypothetical protein ES703_37657 [subsurface metagenome]